MKIAFACPNCRSDLRIEAERASVKVTCPECQAEIPVPREVLNPGTVIGGFRILRLVGRGGMGEVYLARQTSMDRDVALKVLHPSFRFHEEEVARFLNEMRMAARLDHPNVVTAYEAGEDNGIYFLAMAYVNGEPLHERLSRDGPMAEREALRLLRKITLALAYAWDEHRLLHRDVKPANILLDQRGEPKLTDLGLSKSLKEQKEGVSSEVVLGTPNYMSPEYAAGLPEADFRSDMYSLGATLHHMLTGEVPFDGRNFYDTMRQIASEPLPDPRARNPHVSASCVAFLKVLLARGPGDRYASWQALIRDLDRVRAGKPPARQAPPAGLSALAERGASHHAETRQPIQVRHHEIQQRGTAPAAGRHAAQRSRLPVIVTLFCVIVAAILVGLQVHHVKIARRQRTLRRPRDGTPGQGEEQRGGGHDTTRADARGARAVEAAYRALQGEAQRLAGEGDYGAAAALVRDYAGPFAAETAERREDLARSLDAIAAQAEAERTAGAGTRLAALMSDVAARLVKGDHAGACGHVARAAREGAFPGDMAQWVAFRDRVAAVEGMPRAILASFDADRGRRVSVGVQGGPEVLRIVSVDAGTIHVEIPLGGTAFEARELTLADLSTQEKFKRLGTELTPELDLMRGLLACEVEAYDSAKRYFLRSRTPLGEDMADVIDALIAAPAPPDGVIP